MADDIDDLSYRELQERAKEAGIKANQSAEELRAALKAEAEEGGVDFSRMKKDIQDQLGSAGEREVALAVEVEEEVERLSTGVPGLDELLHGGVPRNNLVLVPGGAGSGKSTLGLQFLVEGARNGENGIFVSLDEGLGKIRRNARLLGWDLERYEEEGGVRLIRPEMYDFDDLMKKLDEAVRDTEAERVVIDSLTILGSYYNDMFEVRRKIMDLNRKLAELDTTVLALSEVMEGETGISRYGVEEFAVDGIILLYYVQHGNSFERAVTVRKMRGSSHSKEIHPMEIGLGGIIAYPEEKVFSDF